MRVKRMSSVKVYETTRKRLQEYKEKTGIPMNFVIEKAVDEYLKRKGM